MIYTEINIGTLDSEFNGRSFKKELLKEIGNAKAIFKAKIKHSDVDLYNLVGELSGFKLIETDDYCGGWCDTSTKTIAINTNENHSESVIPTILHEVSHSLQESAGVFDLAQDLMSHELMIEQQCQTMAYILHNKLFNVFDKELYEGYFCKEDVDYLTDWWYGWRQNDLIDG